MTNDETDKATIQPAVAWPSYQEGHAHAELAALRMLVDQVPLTSIRRRTKLSWAHIHRLAEVVSEESRNPAVPRNVMRQPRRRRPARVRVIEPHQEALPEPPEPPEPSEPSEPAEPADSIEPGDAPAIQTTPRPPETPPEMLAAPLAVPEQLSLLCV
ncbi:hypothetical protein [Streptomyces sp. NPDC093589]|uniref:hypothetical protein n=1 Tax=Streptomyces sp. NPDC093589 TaxID=3366043 RepID=UPI00380D023B